MSAQEKSFDRIRLIFHGNKNRDDEELMLKAREIVQNTYKPKNELEMLSILVKCHNKWKKLNKNNHDFEKTMFMDMFTNYLTIYESTLTAWSLYYFLDKNITLREFFAIREEDYINGLGELLKLVENPQDVLELFGDYIWKKDVWNIIVKNNLLEFYFDNFSLPELLNEAIILSPPYDYPSNFEKTKEYFKGRMAQISTKEEALKVFCAVTDNSTSWSTFDFLMTLIDLNLINEKICDEVYYTGVTLRMADTDEFHFDTTEYNSLMKKLINSGIKPKKLNYDAIIVQPTLVIKGLVTVDDQFLDNVLASRYTFIKKPFDFTKYHQRKNPFTDKKLLKKFVDHYSKHSASNELNEILIRTFGPLTHDSWRVIYEKFKKKNTPLIRTALKVYDTKDSIPSIPSSVKALFESGKVYNSLNRDLLRIYDAGAPDEYFPYEIKKYQLKTIDGIKKFLYKSIDDPLFDKYKKFLKICKFDVAIDRTSVNLDGEISRCNSLGQEYLIINCEKNTLHVSYRNERFSEHLGDASYEDFLVFTSSQTKLITGIEIHNISKPKLVSKSILMPLKDAKTTKYFLYMSQIDERGMIFNPFEMELIQKKPLGKIFVVENTNKPDSDSSDCSYDSPSEESDDYFDDY